MVTNFKNISIREMFDKLVEGNPTYSFGEILYSFCRLYSGSDAKISDLINITDEEMYGLIYEASKIEKE